MDATLKARIRNILRVLDSRSLSEQSMALLCGREDILRRVLLAAVDLLTPIELHLWEHVLCSGCAGKPSATVEVIEDEEPPPAEADAEMPGFYEGEGDSQSCFGLSRHGAGTPVSSGVDSGIASHTSKRMMVVGSLRSSRSAARLASLRQAACAASSLGASFALRGHWLALQQELRMKDFVVQQLQRQLGFEQGCGRWLASERLIMEQRGEEQLHYLAVANGFHQGPILTDLGVEEIEADGRRTEDTYMRHSAGWWHSEAQSVETLSRMVEMQSTADQVRLGEEDRTAYRSYISPIVASLQQTFNTRRRDAERIRLERLRVLKQEHGELLQRHVRSAHAMHDVGSPGGRLSATHFGLDSPPASSPSADWAVEVQEELAVESDHSTDSESISQASLSTRTPAASELAAPSILAWSEMASEGSTQEWLHAVCG